MSVVIGDIDTFVSYPVSDRYRRISHFNQKRNMAVSQIVDSDPLDTCGLGTSVHFVMKIAFRKLTFLPLFLNGTVTGAFHKILLVDSP